jgi:2-isopropylmalate synthase
VFAAVIAAGACTINVPDTTGYALPRSTARSSACSASACREAKKVVWSAHCHNDLGWPSQLARRGPERRAQIECTVNGIGERAGNTAMEEIVMAIKTRAEPLRGRHGIVTEQIYPTSRLLAQITGIPIPINKPIVGDNAFAHEAGIHQDGVLKNRLNYEIMKPETVGLDSNRLVLGKHSGGTRSSRALKELGLELGDIDMNRAFERFKALADSKKSVYDEDIIALVAQESTVASATATSSST